jgi:hypothetical protein
VDATTDNTIKKNIKDCTTDSLPVKKCWSVGKHIVVIIDRTIVQQLGIDADKTFVEEEVTPDGILLKVRRIDGAANTND